MDSTAIRVALAELGDDELRALIATAIGGPQTAPGLLAWIEHAADWELHRRLQRSPQVSECYRCNPCRLVLLRGIEPRTY